jgi:hypothetical protein
MDFTLLVQILAPCLPFLLKLGDKAAEKAAEKVGEKTVEKAGSIWAKLLPKVEAKAAAKEAVDDVAANPEDKDLQTVLQVQLKKILESDPALAKEVAALIQEAKDMGGGTQIQVSVSGSDNVAFGAVQGGSKAIGKVDGNVTM